MAQTKYDVIGSNYNQTRRADPYLTRRLMYRLNPNQQGRYLDIGCGTGNYTLALADLGFSFTGVDPSEKMLATAQLRSTNIHWVLAGVEQLPFEDALFCGATGILTLHHWSDMSKAFTEIYRVLQPGANLVLFTSEPAQMQGYWLNHYFPEMMKKSIEQMPSSESVVKAATQSGFKHVASEMYQVQDDLQDGFLYVGKNRPELYFDASIRHGISSFSDLSHADEVQTGLEKLQSDVQSKRIEGIRQKYQNETGDYLFLCFTKSA